MHYAEWNDIEGGWIPADFLLQAFDDNKDGDIVAIKARFDKLAEGVDSTINGSLGRRFSTPFTEPLLAIVKDAARVLTCERIYKRRGVTDEANPWSKNSVGVLARLDRIATNKEKLSVDVESAKPSISIITEPSGTFYHGNNV
ncbi:MAG: DUF1320 family protein [Verrucomicrobia bacterium]|nr:DUF1320 family protein [Verrucomicrobiota bacterium]